MATTEKRSYAYGKIMIGSLILLLYFPLGSYAFLSEYDSVRWAHITPDQFQARVRQTPVAYLPLGTLEWHGEHMPLGSDGLQPEAFFCQLAQRIGGVVLPMIFLGVDIEVEKDGEKFYGMDNYDREYKLKEPEKLAGSAYYTPERLFDMMIEQIVANIVRQGIKILVVHGHHPSMIRAEHLANQLNALYGIKIISCRNGNSEPPLIASNPLQADHGAANETSIMMNYYPELVHIDKLGDDLSRFPKGLGGEDPRIGASPQRGKKIVDVQLERMSKIIKSLLQDASYIHKTVNP